MIGGMARAWIAAGTIAALLAGGLVAAPASRGGDDPYDEYAEDVHIGTVLQRDLDPYEPSLMSAAGIDSVRFWMRWPSLEPNRDEFDWQTTDDTVKRIASAGLTPFPFLFGLPSWAAKQDGFDCEKSDCTPYAPSSPATRTEFGQFAAAAVQRYGTDGTFWTQFPRVPYRPIRAWQIWNEPNLQEFWRPWVDAIGYAELVRTASTWMKAEDERAEVVLAGVSGARTTFTRWSPPVFLERFYSVPGIAASFDGVALHPYAGRPRGMFDRIRASRDVIEAHDPDVDLWITEIGWASSGPRHWSLVKTLRRQATMLRRSFTRLIRRSDDWNLRGIYWYAWRDTDRGKAVCGWCGKAGLRDRDGKAKPAYHMLRRVTSAQ
jgi:hypothetical protein